MSINALGNSYSAANLKKLYEAQQNQTGNFFEVNSKSNNTEVDFSTDGLQWLMNEDEKTGIQEEAINAAEAAKTYQASQAAAAQQANGATNTNAATNEELEKIKEEKEKLEASKKENLEKMDKIEEKIKAKAEAAEEHILEAAKQQEQQVADNEEQSKQVLNEQIAAYVAANKEGGDGMTRDQLQENIKAALPALPGAGDAIAALTAASEEVNEMDSYLSELNDLVQATKNIDCQLSALNEAETAAQKAAEEAAANKQCCDPIGFTVGEGADQVRYDFIKDDGNFDTTSDFLGAKDNWAEMEALDTDGDKVVTAEELKAGGIKAVKTDAQGNKTTVDAAEEFGKDFSIDLNSYKQGGTHSAIDTSTGKQELKGTFDVKIGDQTINGYNTLDDTSFLEQTYGITNDIQQETTTDALSAELQPHATFLETYKQKSEELKKQITEGYENIGVTEENINGINEATKKEADEQAKTFISSLKTEKNENENGNDNSMTANAEGVNETSELIDITSCMVEDDEENPFSTLMIDETGKGPEYMDELLLKAA